MCGVLVQPPSVVLVGEDKVQRTYRGSRAAHLPQDVTVFARDLVDGADVPGRNEVVPLAVLVDGIDVKVV